MSESTQRQAAQRERHTIIFSSSIIFSSGSPLPTCACDPWWLLLLVRDNNNEKQLTHSLRRRKRAIAER